MVDTQVLTMYSEMIWDILDVGFAWLEPGKAFESGKSSQAKPFLVTQSQVKPDAPGSKFLEFQKKPNNFRIHLT